MSRERILAALGGPTARIPFVPIDVEIPRLPGDLWMHFEANLVALGGKVIDREMLATLTDRTWLVDDDAMPFLQGIEFTAGRDPWQSEVGVTLVDTAVAETGSLLMDSRPGHRRLASLSTRIHVAIVPKDCLVETLEGAVARMSDRNSVLISGPSRTADIEGIMVRGIHGPRELWVLAV